MLLPMDSAQVHGDRLWRSPEFPPEYSTPRRDNRPAATPMMNRGSLNKFFLNYLVFEKNFQEPNVLMDLMELHASSYHDLETEYMLFKVFL